MRPASRLTPRMRRHFCLCVMGVGLGFTLLDAAVAQTTLNNPLMRPAPPARETNAGVQPLPPGTPPGAAPAARNQEGPVQAKSLQEEVNANIQRLNADRVPMPLRILLATVYVSAIHDRTAVLRQPIPPSQQAMLAGQGLPAIPGALPGMTPGLPGALPGAVPGAIPGAFPGAVPGALPGAIPGALPGAVPGAPLSAGVGLVNPFASPPPRPTSIRVRDGEAFSFQGFELTARIRDVEVTLLWTNPDERQTIVFQSGIESPSLPAFVPPASQLERPDSGYFGRVQASGTGSGGSATTGGASGGTGGGR